MTTLTFFIIMFAALLHASWNALVKGGSDKGLQMTAIAPGQFQSCLLLTFQTPYMSFYKRLYFPVCVCLLFR